MILVTVMNLMVLLVSFRLSQRVRLQVAFVYDVTGNGAISAALIPTGIPTRQWPCTRHPHVS